MVFWADSTTEDYITAKNNATEDYIIAKKNVQSVSYLLCTQIIKPQIIQKPQNQSQHKIT